MWLLTLQGDFEEGELHASSLEFSEQTAEQTTVLLLSFVIGTPLEIMETSL